MKKPFYTTLIIFFTAQLFAQQNTLPPVGNVGIGTTTPSSKLEVKGKVKIEGGITVDGNVNLTHLPLQAVEKLQGLDILYIDHNGDVVRGKPILGGVGEHGGGGPVDCFAGMPKWENGLNKLFVPCPTVYVGINTDVPKSNLEVNGITQTRKLAIGNVTNTQIKGVFYLKSTEPATVNSPLMVVENGDDKILQLDNNGMLRTREVKLDKQSWPDYVFDQNYVLTPLQEVEKFINEHHHLPNIPAAATVIEEGLNVGDISHVMMEKIEELTLYLIQQEKRLAAQEEEIRKLKSQLNGNK